MKEPFSSRRRRAAWLAASAVALVVLTWVGFASATVIFKAHYSDTDSFSFDDCGFTLDVESEFSGHVRIRADKDGQVFYVNDNYSYRDVVTNPDTEQWFVIRGNGVFNEVKSTHLGGNLYEFVAIDAGQPFVIEDSEGNVVVRDRGVIRGTFLFDSLGDGQPGGILLDIEFAVHGPHPGFADDFPFCEIAAELTGVEPI